jgi:23S rRNA (cytosine1962-C5)-methyltransferase
VGQYRLSDDVAQRVWAGHPWIFKEALGARSLAEPTGTVVELVAFNREFVARGYVDQDHAVGVRVLTRDLSENLSPGSGVVAARVQKALQLRWMLFGQERPEAMRVFAGESEGLPGVTVDRYGEFLVVQWLSAGALPWREELLDALESGLRPKGIYEQRRFRPLAGQAPPEPSVRARGAEAPLELVVTDGAGRFGLDVTAPLGVGIFPDLREARAAVAARSKGRRVLNLFSYTGAFSVAAAKAGAAEVVAVDSAAKAHARARRNYELSDLDPKALEAINGDAVKALERFIERGRRFDIVICDPPSFSQGTAGQFSVARDLSRLAALTLQVLDVGGILAFATNAGKVSALDFDRSLAEGAAQVRAHAQIVGRVGLPADFPVAPGFYEGNYLKFAFVAKS